MPQNDDPIAFFHWDGACQRYVVTRGALGPELRRFRQLGDALDQVARLNTQDEERRYQTHSAMPARRSSLGRKQQRRAVA